MVLISEVEEKEIFKICLEYWNNLAADLYRENPFSSSFSALIVSEQASPPRRQLYLPVLSKVTCSQSCIFKEEGGGGQNAFSGILGEACQKPHCKSQRGAKHPVRMG